MEKVTIHLAKNLKRLRLRQGETQQELAALCGVTETAVSNYETGLRQPDLETLVRLARHFGVTLDELVF